MAPGPPAGAPATVVEVEQLGAETGFSRLPVREDDGSLVGYLHAEDLLAIPDERRHDPVPPRGIRPLTTVAPAAKLQEVMRAMQQRSAHLALVDGTDSKTGEATVLAFEDVLEELVGEVRDATSSAP